MIVNPVVYGGGMELCNGYFSQVSSSLYYFDGRDYLTEQIGFSPESRNVVAPKNSIVYVNSGYGVSSRDLVGVTVIYENGFAMVLRIDSDFRIGPQLN